MQTALRHRYRSRFAYNHGEPRLPSQQARGGLFGKFLPARR
jgi:hypothetical protein